MAKPKVRRRPPLPEQKGKENLLGAKTPSLNPPVLTLCISLVLVVTILCIFWQLRNHEFINLDDDEYVANNARVDSGLTASGAAWAFVTMHAANWHPLTWLSHMMDCELYGLNPGGHHLTSLLFHIANTLLLFWVLKRMTGALWRSGFVAALFALHPLHVESIAWIAERKDVLSTFFWLLTMGAYFRYVTSPGFHRYLLVLLWFVMGLLSKPMVVTLPFVLLLLDYWPLGRFRITPQPPPGEGGGGAGRGSVLQLILEKIPLFALSAAGSVLTLLAQQRGEAVQSLELFPLGIRMGNALVSYAKYIGKMIWPSHLAIFYPYPGRVPILEITGAVLLLGAISFLVVLASHEHRYLLVGWLWYLGTLVPVIGVIQVGLQSMADRYTYVPLIGLFMMAVWGIYDLLKGWRHRNDVLALSAGLLFLVLAITTGVQVSYWQNSMTLFNEALRIDPNDARAHANLGEAFLTQGRYAEAISHLNAALRLNPNLAEVHNNLGVILSRQGKGDEAVYQYTEAVRLKPNFAGAHGNLGDALMGQGKYPEAASQYNEVLWLNPKDPQAHNSLGVILERQGRYGEAIPQFNEALRLNPNFAGAHYNLGRAYLMVGSRGLALKEYQLLERMNPALAKRFWPSPVSENPGQP